MAGATLRFGFAAQFCKQLRRFTVASHHPVFEPQLAGEIDGPIEVEDVIDRLLYIRSIEIVSVKRIGLSRLVAL